jgi:hypothetical protein
MQFPEQPLEENALDIQALAEEDSNLVTAEEESQLDVPTEDDIDTEHYANLAASMDEGELDKIAQNLIDLV